MNVSELIQREGLRRGLRKETVKTYTYAAGKFFRIYKKEPHLVTKREILDYIT